MPNWEITGLSQVEEDAINKKLVEKAIEKEYCTSETCNHTTHPSTRFEVSRENIDSSLKEVFPNREFWVDFMNEHSICFDYYLISPKNMSQKKDILKCDNGNCKKEFDASKDHPVLQFSYKTFHFCSEKCSDEYSE